MVIEKTNFELRLLVDAIAQTSWQLNDVISFILSFFFQPVRPDTGRMFAVNERGVETV